MQRFTEAHGSCVEVFCLGPEFTSSAPRRLQVNNECKCSFSGLDQNRPTSAGPRRAFRLLMCKYSFALAGFRCGCCVYRETKGYCSRTCLGYNTQSTENHINAPLLNTRLSSRCMNMQKLKQNYSCVESEFLSREEMEESLGEGKVALELT